MNNQIRYALVFLVIGIIGIIIGIVAICYVIVL